MTVAPGELGGLPARTLEEIASVLRRFPDIHWVKLYGSKSPVARHRAESQPVPQIPGRGR